MQCFICMGGNLWLDLCLLIKGFFINLSKFGRQFLCAQKRLLISKTPCITPLTSLKFFWEGGCDPHRNHASLNLWNTIFYKHTVFWISLSMLIIFLISTLYYPYNMLKMMGISKPYHHLPPCTTCHYPCLVYHYHGWCLAGGE